MASGGTSTPSKHYVSMAYTPTTKKSVCVVCGRKQESDKHRVKLFKNDKKSEACLLIEKYLYIQLSEDQNVNSVCQTCHRSLLSVQSKLHNHRQNYDKTVSNLRKTHGRISKKRLPFDDLPVTEPKRVSVKPDESSENIPVEALEDGHSSSKNILNFKVAVDQVSEKVQQEIKTLCSKETNSILRGKTEEELATFSWTKMSEELKKYAPTFWQFLEKCAYNPRQKTINVQKTEEAILPGIASAACKLISLYNRDMDSVQRLHSLVLLRGGAKKSTFRRLNATHDCLSYSATLSMADKFGLKWENDLMKWVNQVDKDIAKEKHFIQEIQELEEDGVFLDDPIESASNLFLVENAKTELDHHRLDMHPGFYFVGDNIDMRTKVRQMTLKNQNKDEHMFQICAYKNRISGNHLDNTKPKDDIETVPFRTFLPDDQEKDALVEEFSHIVATQWADLIPNFRPYITVLPKHIKHPYMNQTKQKTERINMGVLKNNEQYNEDMTDICAFLNKYVPGAREENDARKPDKVLSGGDYLTFERHKQAQSSKRNARTPMKRMEGLVPKMEEFHNQAEFLQVIWKILYCTASSKDTGTLYAARNAINAKNVSKDPSSNYYASSELVDKFTKAYVVSAALLHFKMESIESCPTENKYEGVIGSDDEMKEYLLQNAKQVVKEFTVLDFPQIPATGYQSNNIVCDMCGKKYKQASTLEKHLSQVHGIVEPECDSQSETTKHHGTTDEDHVLNYSKLSLTLGLLKLNHDDAIRMGDGERIIRLDKVFYLFYKAFDCSKYAYGLLETMLQTKVLLSERLAHRLIWNRTVNNNEQLDSNLPNDLDIEHCNKVFKDEAHSYRGVFTDKVVSRVSRSAMKTEMVLKNYDKVSKVVRPSGRHTLGDLTCDIVILVQQFKARNLFGYVSGRRHSAFREFKLDQLSLDMNDFRDWLSRSMKKIAKKHFYR